MRLVDVIRKARKTYRDTGNDNQAIFEVRTARPDVGLEGAQSFWAWIRTLKDIFASELSKWWCEKHWQPVGKCEIQQYVCAKPWGTSQTNAATAGATGGTKPVFDEGVLSDSVTPEFCDKVTATSNIEQNKDRCPCGRKPCTDEFHANLAALIRKHGNSRTVELIYISMGLKEPENEEQARMVEAQPGYKPFYKEQQQ